MAVVGIAQERPDSPEGGGDLKGAQFTRKFRVLTDDLGDGPVIVCGAPGLPKLGSYYVAGNEFHNYCRCRRLNAVRIQPASMYWEVTAEYETPTWTNRSEGFPREVQGENDNPLLQLAEIETTMEKYQQVVYFIIDAKTGKIAPATASNDQVFDPPPMKDASRLILTITRNEAISDLHPALGVKYQDAVNRDVFWGLPPGQWKCQGVVAHRQTKQLSSGMVLPYLKVVYKFEARETWDLMILDAGTYYYDSNVPAVAKKRLAFKTEDGHPRTGALDGTGTPLLQGAVPVFNTYRVYARKAFGALGLPQSYLDAA